MLVNIIITAILVLILGGAVTYIVRAKKNGEKCIGCPHSKKCSSIKQGSCCCSDSKASEKSK